MADDPVNEFLQREKDELADLNEEPQQDFILDSSGNVDFFASEAQPGGVPLTDDFLPDGTDFPHDSIDDIGAPIGLGDMSLDETKSEDETPVPVYERPKIEPEKLRIWREEFQKRIEKKDAEEAMKLEEMRRQAKRELEDWYKKYDEQLEKNSKQNKLAEEEFIRERDAAKPGKEWEKITNLCEFNPKAAKNTKDVSRLRGLLLQLKAGGGAEK